MTFVRPTAVATVLVLGAVAVAAGPHAATATAPAAPELAPPPTGTDWREVVQQAVVADRSRHYEGRLAIVGVGPDGPTLTEIEVRRHGDDGVVVGDAEAWLVGHDGGAGFVWGPDAGTVRMAGAVEPLGPPLEDLDAKYDVAVAGIADLATGAALALEVREDDSGLLRERLYVDRLSHLVVRRDTFDVDGEPVRVVAFTHLVVTRPELAPPETAVGPDDDRTMTALDPGDLDALAGSGWAAPTELPGGFLLRGGYELSEGERSSLHLVYSDGLYTLSVYQQMGRLDVGALDGARIERHGDVEVRRWPGAQPERVVWSGESRTFTLVTDAPVGEAVRAVEGLPSDPPPGIGGRLLRGLARLADRLWPFG